MTNQKPYKSGKDSDGNMFPGDPSGSPDDNFSTKDKTLVFLDDGFLYKLSSYLRKSEPLTFNRLEFAKNLAKKQNLICERIFYYNAPPFQSEPPTKDEEIRREGYDKFIKSLQKNEGIIISEGRCQRLKIDGEYVYKQKGVDTLLTIDLSHIKEDFPKIKKIILVSSDTDFCPIISDIKERNNVEVILYSYFDRKRNSKFSVSNELIQCCSKFVQLTKEDFDGAQLKKKNKK